MIHNSPGTWRGEATDITLGMGHVTQIYLRHVENKLEIIRCLGYTEYGAMCCIESTLCYRLQAIVKYYKIFSIILRIILFMEMARCPAFKRIVMFMRLDLFQTTN